MEEGSLLEDGLLLAEPAPVCQEGGAAHACPTPVHAAGETPVLQSISGSEPQKGKAAKEEGEHSLTGFSDWASINLPAMWPESVCWCSLALVPADARRLRERPLCGQPGNCGCMCMQTMPPVAAGGSPLVVCQRAGEGTDSATKDVN